MPLDRRDKRFAFCLHFEILRSLTRAPFEQCIRISWNCFRWNLHYAIYGRKKNSRMSKCSWCTLMSHKRKWLYLRNMRTTIWATPHIRTSKWLKSTHRQNNSAKCTYSNWNDDNGILIHGWTFDATDTPSLCVFDCVHGTLWSAKKRHTSKRHKTARYKHFHYRISIFGPKESYMKKEKHRATYRKSNEKRSLNDSSK